MAFTAAKGTLIKKGDGASPEVFTTVAQIGADITGPGQKSDTIDTTTHNQSTPYKAFIAGLREGGDIKFPVFFDGNDSTHTGLITTFEAGVPVNWQLVPPFSPAIKWSFAGLLTDIGHTYKIKDATMADITIKVSGKPTLA
jgi:predicted secreted protein